MIDYLKITQPTVVSSNLTLWIDDHLAILVTPKKPHSFVSG